MATTVYKVTPIVGSEPEFADAAEELRRVIFRTVEPATWLDMGGLETLRTYFNPVSRDWYLIASTNGLDAKITGVLQALGNP